MQRIINFIIRNQSFLLFLLLFLLALFFTFQSHSYHKSKFINSANFLSGGIYSSTNSISQYFGLKDKNAILIEENNYLRSLLHNTKIEDTTHKDSIATKYKIVPATVSKNSYAQTNNYLLIDEGEDKGIQKDFGVISSKGIIGIVDNTSSGYARVQSILNTNSKINAQLKKTNHYGTLEWNTKSPGQVQLVDIEKIAPLVIGDTIITGGKSTIFPKGILIGTVTSFELDAAEDFYEVEIQLFNDMTNIGHVYVIENKDSEQINTVLKDNE